MKKGRFSEEQIIGILKRHEAGQKVADLSLDKEVLKAVISRNLWSAAELQASTLMGNESAQIYPVYLWAGP